jgi:hypothetical protein
VNPFYKPHPLSMGHILIVSFHLYLGFPTELTFRLNFQYFPIRDEFSASLQDCVLILSP